MLLRIRINVVSVEIVAKCVHAEVSSVNSIYVDHGHNHKYKHLSQQICSKISFTSEKL
jgi:hypothetical protein